MAKPKDVLTTGQVAKICNVAPRTVSKWFDNGQLRGYRIPGSKDRRIPLSHLVRFMKAHGIPLNGLDTGTVRVLFLDGDKALSELVRQTLTAEGRYDVMCASTAFEAGAATESFGPDVFVVDVLLPDVCPERLCRDLRASESLQLLKVVAVSTTITDGEEHALLQQGFDAYLPKPFDVRRLIDTIDGTLQSRA